MRPGAQSRTLRLFASCGRVICPDQSSDFSALAFQSTPPRGGGSCSASVLPRVRFNLRVHGPICFNTRAFARLRRQPSDSHERGGDLRSRHPRPRDMAAFPTVAGRSGSLCSPLPTPAGRGAISAFIPRLRENRLLGRRQPIRRRCASFPSDSPVTGRLLLADCVPAPRPIRILRALLLRLPRDREIDTLAGTHPPVWVSGLRTGPSADRFPNQPSTAMYDDMGKSSSINAS